MNRFYKDVLVVFMFYFLLTFVTAVACRMLISNASADEPVDVFVVENECTIDSNLRVHGKKRLACVEKLEVSAKLARGEMRVNERH